ncbi:MAG TPA: 2OG-Fe(II) oxygenase [Candidatus Limnocylindrales bacterium]|nr:2OG-Fe(II) oxygenase [Candidatus Limnocylindrales bacterium]
METQDRPRIAPTKIAERVSRLAWGEVRENLWGTGFSRLGGLLEQGECEELRSLYARPELFRSRIEMERFRFGKGEYQYFAYPLPTIVAELREALYGPLAPIANEWMQALGLKGEFPGELEDFVKKCRARGQKRPTPLVLRYRAGDYNCLHQDVYGEVVFPFQVIVCLSRPEEEFTGGELLLVEQRPRAQSVGHVVRLGQGEAAVITTRYRPAKGARGFYRTNFRHGVSEILSGERFTLGVIFHDAA